MAHEFKGSFIREGEILDASESESDELNKPRDFSVLKGLTYNFTDEEWQELDQQILESHQYSTDSLF